MNERNKGLGFFFIGIAVAMWLYFIITSYCLLKIFQNSGITTAITVMTIVVSAIEFLLGFVVAINFISNTNEPKKVEEAKEDEDGNKHESYYSCNHILDSGWLVVSDIKAASSRYKEELKDNPKKINQTLCVKETIKNGEDKESREYYDTLIYTTKDKPFDIHSYFRDNSIFNYDELYKIESKIIELAKKTTLGTIQEDYAGFKVWTLALDEFDYSFVIDTSNVEFVDSEGYSLGKGFVNPVDYNVLLDAIENQEYFNNLVRLKNILELDIARNNKTTEEIKKEFNI